MAWKESNDDEVTECLDRLITKQAELQTELSPIDLTIKNLKQIKNREYDTFDKDRVRKVNIMKPKDKWGNDMKDADRIKIKNECIAETLKLLGESTNDE